MFSKEVQIEAVTMYLQGIPPYKIRKKFGSMPKSFRPVSRLNFPPIFGVQFRVQFTCTFFCNG
ncbi:hypothetical protein FOL01_1984 [Weissella jogaejeotgali]|uniref:Uncharacterized protein n=1 Tax=Weissella jogaejeotgali TaxID=1631871 RepID=A0A1L6RE79_9LACO|nr:hypothetical protein FOL01_1984 [Weissella jogaejeotgali]